MSTEAIIDKDKLYNAVKTATQNLTAIDDNTLQEYLDEGIKNEFLTAGSIEGIIELVKVLDDVVDGIVNKIGLNTKKISKCFYSCR